MDKKIIFIPGWMKSVSYYSSYPGQDIWQGKFDIGEVLDADYIVSHSLGCNYILSKWDSRIKAKCIFINPLLPQKNLFYWMWQWLKFSLLGGMRHDEHNSLLHLPKAIIEFLKIGNIDLLRMMNNIGKNRFTVLRGVGDRFFCDNFSVKALRRENIYYIEIDDLGHEWDKRYMEEISKIIEKEL